MNLVENTIECEILPHTITAYNPFRAKIAEMQEVNAKTVFQYNTPKGNKDARSYVFDLRKSKAAVEKVRVAEKAASLEYGRKVDSEAKDIIALIEKMIEVHQTPLDAIEAKEKARVAAIQSSIDFLKKFQECAGHSSEEIRNALEILNNIDVDASYEEFQIEAEKQKALALQNQQDELVVAEKREAEAAELERLRKEAAEREKKEREDKIAQDAADTAKKQAEDDAAQKIKDADDAKKAAEAETEAANKRADDAAQAERDKIANEQAEKDRLDLQRKQNEVLVAKTQSTIAISIMDATGISEKTSELLVKLVHDGKIPHLFIKY